MPEISKVKKLAKIVLREREVKKMKTHRIKLNEFYEEDVLSGRKNFEVRLNDRGYQAGDLVIFTVIDDLGIRIPSPLNEKKYRITYVHSGLGLKESHVVFGIAPSEEEENG